MNKKIFIVAGEASGDTRGKEIVEQLQQLSSDLKFEGLGGNQLASSGVTIFYDLPSVAVVGLTEVLAKYFFFRKIFYSTLNRIKTMQPDAVILIDYPGFNLRLAKKIKQLNIPVIYYISPQIWAWANWRVKKIAQIVDKMLVILPFEVEFYKQTNLDVSFVGHPLIDSFKPSDSSENIKKQLKIENGKRLILILAGSRTKEVEKILPPFINAAEILYRKD